MEENTHTFTNPHDLVAIARNDLEKLRKLFKTVE
jgi:hypothetical protein